MKSEKEIISWYKKHLAEKGEPYLLDKNQARVIMDEHKNTLVTARAGSGKTRTLVAKIAYLIAYKHIVPEKIIVFAFNRKACFEINERLTKITYNGKPLFLDTPHIATTFHAFAYAALGGRKQIGNRLISEEENIKILQDIIPDDNSIGNVSQFITRAEQRFFKDYTELKNSISLIDSPCNQELLTKYYEYLVSYHAALKRKNLINFNQMMSQSRLKLRTLRLPYKYIFVDEYQDFSLLFLEQLRALRANCDDSHLLAVGDDWQAINRFAGSDVEFFKNFEKYFSEDVNRLFIPSNYRSGKQIVKNANYFMSCALKDFKGCKTGNRKLRAKIYLADVNALVPRRQVSTKIPLLLLSYIKILRKIIVENKGKTIKILHRNNDLSFRGYSLDSFCKNLVDRLLNEKMISKNEWELISWTTIHKSKGLEADVVILLEVDAKKFPSKDKTNGLYEIFGEDEKAHFEDEARLFYVALTRPKEKLYILSKTTRYIEKDKKMNFLSYLNDDWIRRIV